MRDNLMESKKFHCSLPSFTGFVAPLPDNGMKSFARLYFFHVELLFCPVYFTFFFPQLFLSRLNSRIFPIIRTIFYPGGGFTLIEILPTHFHTLLLCPHLLFLSLSLSLSLFNSCLSLWSQKKRIWEIPERVCVVKVAMKYLYTEVQSYFNRSNCV